MPVEYKEKHNISIICEVCGKKQELKNNDFPEGYVIYSQYGDRLENEEPANGEDVNDVDGNTLDVDGYELNDRLLTFHKDCFEELKPWIKEHMGLLIRANAHETIIKLDKPRESKTILILYDDITYEAKVIVFDTVEQAIECAKENISGSGDEVYPKGCLIINGVSHHISPYTKVDFNNLVRKDTTMTVGEIKARMIERIKAMPHPVEFLVGEADGDYGYRMHKDLTISSIGDYSNPDAKTLEDLSIVDLANFLFRNDDECKKWRKEHNMACD